MLSSENRGERGRSSEHEDRARRRGTAKRERAAADEKQPHAARESAEAEGVAQHRGPSRARPSAMPGGRGGAPAVRRLSPP